jgi:hypothetical protein
LTTGKFNGGDISGIRGPAADFHPVCRSGAAHDSGLRAARISVSLSGLSGGLRVTAGILSAKHE